MLIDSGADINAIGENDWERIGRNVERGEASLTNLVTGDPRKSITAYAAAAPLKVTHTFDARVEAGNRGVDARFFAIRGAGKSLLGRSTATALGVLKLGLGVNACDARASAMDVEEFPSVPDEVVHFDVDPAVVPTRNRYYSVPAAFRARARERLEMMKRQGIIEDVRRAPGWISGMSLVPKGANDFRLVVNMRGPNRAIKRAFHRLPTIEEMRSKLAGAKVFSKLDLKSAFHHLRLDEQSRDMTTFQTESGMCRFTRLVFGVNCAPEIFQAMLERKLAGVLNIIVYIDDILVFAEELETLRATTKEVKSRLKSNNLSINEDKCEYDKTGTVFLGHKLSADGFEIDAHKVRDVQKFRQPGSATEARSFLGLASYLSDYIPYFADLVKPMWDASAAKPFAWNEAAQEAFLKTKGQIASCTTALGFFSEDDKTVLYTDASPVALGAVLTQETGEGSKRIISFASKVLSAVEQKYPQIQREALGVVWAVERFFYYLLGRHFTIRTDARGLAFIFDRDRTVCKRALNRADGWALRLNLYDYEVEWIKGTSNIADSPSRLLTESMPHPGRQDPLAEVCPVICNEASDIGALTKGKIREATERDAILTAVQKALATGEWPTGTEAFRKIADELRDVDGIVMRLGAVVMPTELKNEALELAHAGHPGQSAMISIMRSRVWWPRMVTEAKAFVAGCRGCSLVARAEKPVPMLRTVLPEATWSRLAIDFNGPHAAVEGKSILVLVDYRSRYLVAEFIASTDFNSVGKVLDRIFDQFGNPATLRSDKGPPFNGAEWRHFCQSRGIEPEFSTPGHPQQNGLVERNMQICNKAVTMAIEQGRDARKALRKAVQAHNAADHRTTNMPPEGLMFGRRLRRDLPLFGNPTFRFDEQELRERDAAEKGKGQEKEDRKRGARGCQIKAGDLVLLKRVSKAKDQTPFDPRPFTVVEVHHGDATIKGEDGRVFKRNVTALKKVQEIEESDSDELSDEEGETAQRPQRARKPPARLADYVQVVEIPEQNVE
jgi:hypothetical protein